jgi:hypothetical protein
MAQVCFLSGNITLVVFLDPMFNIGVRGLAFLVTMFNLGVRSLAFLATMFNLGVRGFAGLGDFGIWSCLVSTFVELIKIIVEI